MSQLEIEKCSLILNQDCTFESVINQLQKYTENLLCVVDGSNLKSITKKSNIPKNLRFEHKQKRLGNYEYYFRGSSDGKLYCVFGRTAAKCFYPEIDLYDKAYVDEEISNETIEITNVEIRDHEIEDNPLLIERTDSSKPINSIVVEFGGKKSVFPISKSKKFSSSSIN